MTQVLMYHGIVASDEDIPPNRLAGARDYDVSLKNFEAQMNALAEDGVEVVRPRGESLVGTAKKRAMITFDDGEANNLTRAVPVLQARGWSAIVFITVGWIGRPGYLTWPQVAELVEAGMRVGAHGWDHRVLTACDEATLDKEILESRKALAQALGEENVRDFSVPGGAYDERVVRRAREAGFERIFVSRRRPGVAEDVIPRLAVKGAWSLETFRRRVAGEETGLERAQDWTKDTMRRLVGDRVYDRVRRLICGGDK